MKLIIAEKPVLGRAIAAVLPGSGREKDGVIVKDGYTVTWAFGHLLQLKEPKDYDPSLEKWTLSGLPLYWDNWAAKPASREFAARLKLIAALAQESECVIHAGDPDDEGQYLIDEILSYIRYSKPVYRMQTGDTTPAALKKALGNLQDNRAFVPLGLSAYARSVADLTVGINASRYFTLKNPKTKMLSVGRVQTAALGLVVQRDEAIENHIRRKYYTVSALLGISGGQYEAKYVPAKDDPHLEDGKIFSPEYAASRAGYLKGRTLAAEVKKTKSRKAPPLPFNLVELQSHCSARFGFEPSLTLRLTQTLREDYNAITYNRSDCRYLSEEQYREAPETLEAVTANLHYRPGGLDQTLHSACFNDAIVSKAAHTAIIPTNSRVDINALPEREKKVYLAICQYYLAQFLPPAQLEKTALTAPAGDDGTVQANSTEVLSPGWMALFRNDKKSPLDENEQRSNLSELAAGNYEAPVLDTRTEEKETQPPVRYTKASLNKDMTRVSRYVKDPKIRALLQAKDAEKKDENGSIGTPATRAEIIDTLEKRGFIAAQGKSVISTPLGRELYRILPDELKKADTTGLWWAIQEDIRGGKADWRALPESVLASMRRIVTTEYPAIDLEKIPPELLRSGGGPKSVGRCPRCGKPVIKGRAAYGCSGWKEGCRFKIWIRPKGKLFEKISITEANATALLAGKRIKKTALMSKAGNRFPGWLKMEDDGQSEWGASLKLELK